MESHAKIAEAQVAPRIVRPMLLCRFWNKFKKNIEFGNRMQIIFGATKLILL